MEKKKRGFGIAALVLGILGFLTAYILIGLFLDILAIIFGLIAIKSKKRKSALGVVGLIIAICSIVLYFTGAYTRFLQPDSGTITNIVPKGASTTNNSNKDFEVTEYHFKDGFGNTTYILVIKNNAKKNYTFEGQVTAVDTNGKKAEENALGEDYLTGDVLPSESGCLMFNFKTERVEKFEYNVTYCECVDKSIKSLQMKELQNDNGVTVTGINNSSKKINLAHASVLFFNGNLPVGYDSHYFDDINQEKGSSLKFVSNQKFDNYKTFYWSDYELSATTIFN